MGSHASVAIAGDAGVGVDFVDDAAVDAVEVDSAGGVAGASLGAMGMTSMSVIFTAHSLLVAGRRRIMKSGSR